MFLWHLGNLESSKNLVSEPLLCLKRNIAILVVVEVVIIVTCKVTMYLYEMELLGRISRKQDSVIYCNQCFKIALILLFLETYDVSSVYQKPFVTNPNWILLHLLHETSKCLTLNVNAVTKMVIKTLNGLMIASRATWSESTTMCE